MDLLVFFVVFLFECLYRMIIDVNFFIVCIIVFMNIRFILRSRFFVSFAFLYASASLLFIMFGIECVLVVGDNYYLLYICGDFVFLLNVVLFMLMMWFFEMCDFVIVDIIGEGLYLFVCEVFLVNKFMERYVLKIMDKLYIVCEGKVWYVVMERVFLVGWLVDCDCVAALRFTF